MGKKEKILLAIGLSDAILGSWFSVWWIKSFSVLLSSGTLSLSQIVRNIASIIVMYHVIRKHENPSRKLVAAVIAISYLGLFMFFVSLESFWTVSTFLGVFTMSFAGTFSSSLKVQNLDANRRNKFDNMENFVTHLGAIFGGSIAFFFLAEGVPYWLVWLVAYLLFDMDLWMKMFLIQKGFLVYDRNFNVETK